MVKCYQLRLTTTVSLFGQTVHLIVQIESVRYNYLYRTKKDLATIDAIADDVAETINALSDKSSYNANNKDKVDMKRPSMGIEGRLLSWYPQGLVNASSAHRIYVQNSTVIKADLKQFLKNLSIANGLLVDIIN